MDIQDDYDLLTLLILILEDVLTSGPINQSPTPYSIDKGAPHTKSSSPNSSKPNLEKLRKSTPCWLEEDYDIIEECAPCTKFEISSQSPAACTETGLKEKITCKVSGTTFRSCSSVKAIERRNFVIFVSSTLLVFVLSFGYVKFRTSQLERITIKNIEKRLAAGQ